LRGVSAAPFSDGVKNLKSSYQTGSSDLAKDFFSPCLQDCLIYKRAAGFFSSSALATWAGALPSLCRRSDVIIKMIIAPILSAEDKTAIERATSAENDDVFQEVADRYLEAAVALSEDPSRKDLQLQLLTWLIASGKLELKFAFAEHVNDPGIFHEKYGIFEFPAENFVAFTGSANESSFGHRRNYESVDVFRSWIEADKERVDAKRTQFEFAWDGKAIGLKTKSPSLEVLDKIRIRAPSEYPKGSSETKPHVDSSSGNKWAHQDRAVEAFLKQGRGVLEMATGTGKTRTALKIVDRLIRDKSVDTILISTEGVDLLSQWHKQVIALTSKYKWITSRHFGGYHDRDIFLLNPNQSIFLTSNSSLHTALRGIPASALARTLVIFDEVHRLGSPATRSSLNGLLTNVRFRLGLSATPEREYDADGNDFVEKNVGPDVFRFELADAIRKRILTPFNYIPLRYELTPEDKQAMKAIAAQLARLKASGAVVNEEEFWIRMSRVVKTSVAKIPVFSEYIRHQPDLLRRCIIFVETVEYGEQVYDLVHRIRPDYHTYFAGDDPEVLNRFSRGELECLITCHRLSEGIDVRSTQTVILFSSARARLETIQRIGRCLRVDPENLDKVANVVDFIREVGDDENPSHETADQEREAWLTELSQIRPETINAP